MKDSKLLDELHRFVEHDLRSLLKGDTSSWHTLDVNYEPPHVERVWFQHKDYRVNLHRIHPCKEALYHPHPWPSAVFLLSGVYESVIGTEHMTVATQCLVGGDSYAMSNPLGWHSVKPLKGKPSHSVMLTWSPFDPQVYDHGNFGKKAQLGPLSEETKAQVLQAIGDLVNVHYPQSQI